MRESQVSRGSFATRASAHGAVVLAEQFRAGTLRPSEYLDSLFTYIELEGARTNCLTSLQKKAAFEAAGRLETQGPLPGESLFGVPIVLKENIQKVGFPVQCGSRILQGYVGQFDATVVKRLEAAGAIVIGTANMDEFAMGSSNENSVHGPVRNPHDHARVSGGSSGGSAVASALGFAPLTLGSDTGGSVRQPAAYCGVYGFKPSYGRVSRYGLVAYGSSLDQISPFARCAADLDAILTVMAGEDPHDATTLPGRYVSTFGRGSLAGTRIGIPSTLLANTGATWVVLLLTFQVLGNFVISRRSKQKE